VLRICLEAVPYGRHESRTIIKMTSEKQFGEVILNETKNYQGDSEKEPSLSYDEK